MRATRATGCALKKAGYQTALKLVSGVATVGLLDVNFWASGSLGD